MSCHNYPEEFSPRSPSRWRLGQWRGAISLRLDSLSDTSVLIRMPAASEVRSGPSAPSTIKPSSDRKVAVACEPPVSVLTEVAKELQPGRCVT